MSLTTATIGYGYILAYCATLGGSYVPIGEILELKPGKITVEKVVIQRNDSPDLFGEKISGWKDAGDWDVKLVYNNTIRATLESLVAVNKFWKFTRPNGTSTSAFYGFMCELGDEVPLKQEMTSDFKLCISGAATFTS